MSSTYCEHAGYCVSCDRQGCRECLIKCPNCKREVCKECVRDGQCGECRTEICWFCKKPGRLVEMAYSSAWGDPEESRKRGKSATGAYAHTRCIEASKSQEET